MFKRIWQRIQNKLFKKLLALTQVNKELRTILYEDQFNRDLQHERIRMEEKRQELVRVTRERNEDIEAKQAAGYEAYGKEGSRPSIATAPTMQLQRCNKCNLVHVHKLEITQTEINVVYEKSCRKGWVRHPSDEWERYMNPFSVEES